MGKNDKQSVKGFVETLDDKLDAFLDEWVDNLRDLSAKGKPSDEAENKAVHDLMKYLDPDEDFVVRANLSDVHEPGAKDRFQGVLVYKKGTPQTDGNEVAGFRIYGDELGKITSIKAHSAKYLTAVSRNYSEEVKGQREAFDKKHGATEEVKDDNTPKNRGDSSFSA